MSSGRRHGWSHTLNGGMSVPSSPSRNETGHPCRLPESVVSGVLMSACASTCRQPLRARAPAAGARHDGTYPDHRRVGVLALGAGDGAHGLVVSARCGLRTYERVVSAERERELARVGDARDVVREPLVDGGHGDGAAQLADRRAVGVRVRFRVIARERRELGLGRGAGRVLDAPAQLLQLRRQPRLDQRPGALVDPRARLPTGEPVRENLQSAPYPAAAARTSTVAGSARKRYAYVGAGSVSFSGLRKYVSRVVCARVAPSAPMPHMPPRRVVTRRAAQSGPRGRRGRRAWRPRRDMAGSGSGW